MLEVGVHLARTFWSGRYGEEAARAVIDYAWEHTAASALVAEHGPDNVHSKALVERLGFRYTHHEPWGPHSTMHPYYRRLKQDAIDGCVFAIIHPRRSWNMSNAQFYTAIAVPSVLVIISWVLVAFSWMQQDKRLARIDSVIDSMRAENIAFRDSIHRDNLTLRENIHRDNLTLRDSIHRDMIPMHERLATVEARLS